MPSLKLCPAPKSAPRHTWHVAHMPQNTPRNEFDPIPFPGMRRVEKPAPVLKLVGNEAFDPETPVDAIACVNFAMEQVEKHLAALTAENDRPYRYMPGGDDRPWAA